MATATKTKRTCKAKIAEDFKADLVKVRVALTCQSYSSITISLAKFHR